MHLDLHYTDPRLVSMYDTENSGRNDFEFYIELATQMHATSIVDLGCGTGVLACDLSAGGHAVVGVDPARAMLDVARQRSGGQYVRWVEGDSASLDPASADLLVMTGHVAQVFLSEEAWLSTLGDAFLALKPGGHLAFETLNPDAESWRQWTTERTFGTYDLDEDRFESWMEVTEVHPGRVTVEGHTVFASAGEHHIAASTLRFRTQIEIEASLSATGFRLERVYGDWDRRPVTPTCAELIFVAYRP